MISKLMATVNTMRSAPPSRLTPMIAAGLILFGSRMMAKYTNYQRAIMADQAQELGDLLRHVQAVRAELGPDTTPATVYPTGEDTDPLHRADEDN